MPVEPSEVHEHMEVLGSDRQHVGKVDHVDGHRIKLAKTDPAAGGEHHFIHLDSVEAVEGDTVILNRTAAEAKDEWGVEKVGS